MSARFVVGYDGSAASMRAVEFAIAQGEASGASVLIAHVLEWSPYSFLTPEELEERHKRRKEELARAEEAVIGPLKSMMSASSAQVDTVIKYGHVAETLSQIAKDEGASQLFIGRDGDSGITSRLFGSVAGGLAQISPVPCTIVP